MYYPHSKHMQLPFNSSGGIYNKSKLTLGQLSYFYAWTHKQSTCVPVRPLDMPLSACNTCSTCLCADCRDRPIDLVVVIDSSGSIAERGINFQSMLEIVKLVVEGLVIGQDATRVGAVYYSNLPSVSFLLNTYTTTSGIVDRVVKTPFVGGTTNVEVN